MNFNKARTLYFHNLLMVFCFYLSSATVTAQNTAIMRDEWYQRSIKNTYTTAPIQEIFKRAEVNKKLTVGVIGGSITAGANASDFQQTAYAPLVVQWFRKKFPQTEIHFVNAGIGATNSLFGVHRVDGDLLSYKPDIVIIEFSVNDQGESRTKASYEGLIRKILKSENKPAILALGLMDMQGNSWQKYHLEVCNHYHIPYISYRDALYPEIQNGNMVWSEISSDEVHPNDRGHQIISNLVTHFLEEIFNEKTLPVPLTQNKYEQACIYPFTHIDNPDWELTSRGWSTTHKGKPLEFTVKASIITIMFEKTINSQKAANVYVTLDNGKRQKLSTFFKDGWGNYMYPEIILDSDKSESHIISFEYDDKSGKEFILHNIQIVP